MTYTLITLVGFGLGGEKCLGLAHVTGSHFSSHL